MTKKGHGEAHGTGGKSSRRYSQRTLGLLWGRSGNTCAHPECKNELIVGATEFDEAAILGHIAHIHSSSDKGPRAAQDMKPEQRDSYENLLLLCRHHHGLVDAQDSTYTAEELRSWKERHEAAVEAVRRTALAQHMNRVAFPELEAAARVLLATRPSGDEKLIALPPDEKMRLNDLGDEPRFLLTVGASKSDEVGRFIAYQSQLDEGYAGRLRGGFVAEYRSHRSAGLRGDDLFEAMRVFACGGATDEPRKLAGLAILTHLFILCDVFETANGSPAE